MKFLPSPAAVLDQPHGLERGGVFDAAWVPSGFRDGQFRIMPSNASPFRAVPPRRVPSTPMGYARLSAAGLGDHLPQRQGIFEDTPWTRPTIDAMPVHAVPMASPEWVREQMQARLITRPVGAWPDGYVRQSVFR